MKIAHALSFLLLAVLLATTIEGKSYVLRGAEMHYGIGADGLVSVGRGRRGA